MWRNVYYDNSRKKIFLWSWDKEGNRKKFDFDYEPYLYIETNNPKQEEAKSLFGTSLRKLTFKKESDRNEYVKTSGIRRFFYNLRAEQQFLLDLYKDKEYDWTKLPFKTFIIDIEVYSPHEFPEADEAKHPINVVTIYDNISETFNVWGLNPYDKSTLEKSLGENNATLLDPKKIVYTHCKSERELLEKFLSYWRKDYPDAIIGWNIEGFDIPYIINRIGYILGDEEVKTLSPVNKLYVKLVENAKFGKELNKWFIRGITLLDYMDLYKTFSRGEQGSYSLNNIAKAEEVGSKLEFEGELHKLADQNWDHFVNYNIHDVNLVKLLDDKLHYLTIARFLAYKGFAKIEDSLGKIMIVTGAMCKEANKMGKIIPTFPPANVQEDYVGGYVREPQRGLQEAVVSFDANSLYPNTIITLNLSPETKIGKIVYKDEETCEVKFTNGKLHKFTPKQLDEFCSKGKIALSSANVLYRQDAKGICPTFIDSLYQERVEIQRQLQELEVQEPTPEIKAKALHLDQMQHTIKIFLNSAYGTYANRFSPFYDIDMAASITETGQAVIKEAANCVNEYFNQGSDIAKDHIVYGDTDSIYLTIKDCLRKNNIPLSNADGSISKEAVEQTDILQKHINDNINEWARNSLHSTDPRFFFKRENICDTGIFLEKKRYILSVRHDGKRNKHKFKYVGVEVQRSTYSESIKAMMKEVVTTIFNSKDRLVSDAKYREVYERFKTFDIDEIAFRSSIKDYNKYASISEGFKIGAHTPIHVKSAIYFNHLREILNLKSVYPPIVSGTKIKYIYTARNKYGIKCIGFNDKLPKEFDINVDIEEMFESLVAPFIERVYNCIGWNVPDMRRQYQSDFLELFGS
jgi:DNA polymerase elongation subunit (family B)